MTKQEKNKWRKHISSIGKKNAKVLDSLTFPKRMIKGNSIFELTKYGSYIDTSLYGMTQEKNAMSFVELYNAGYKSEK